MRGNEGARRVGRPRPRVRRQIMQAPRIQTERLVLKALQPGDAPAVYAYRCDPAVYRYQSWRPAGVEEVRRFIEALAHTGFDREGTWFQLGIYLRAEGAPAAGPGERGAQAGAPREGSLVGDLGLHFLPPEGRQVEIGFTVSPAHQRRGYAEEAVRALIGYLFGALGKHRIIGSVDPRNSPSIALLEKLGLRREAHFRRSIWADGGWQDDVVYALLQEEWQAC